jgi:hypothetical protein
MPPYQFKVRTPIGKIITTQINLVNRVTNEVRPTLSSCILAPRWE